MSNTLSLQPVEAVRLFSFVKCSECGRVLTKNAIRYIKKKHPKPSHETMLLRACSTLSRLLIEDLSKKVKIDLHSQKALAIARSLPRIDHRHLALAENLAVFSANFGLLGLENP